MARIEKIILPDPFYRLDFVIVDAPDGEDETNIYSRSLLYLADHVVEGGLALLKRGPRRALPKAALIPPKNGS